MGEGESECRGRGGALLAWLTTADSPQITIEIYISDWTHKFHHKTGLDAKANSELYKSNRVNSANTDLLKKKILLPISKPCLWLLISEVELFIRPPVKKNPGKNVSKYF